MQGCAPLGGAALEAGSGSLTKNVEIGLALFGSLAVGIATLFGLQNEAVALVGVNPAKALGAVGFLLKDTALKHIIVVGIVGAAALGLIDADQPAKTVDETLRVRQLGAAGGCPFGNEGFDLSFI